MGCLSGIWKKNYIIKTIRKKTFTNRHHPKLLSKPAIWEDFLMFCTMPFRLIQTDQAPNMGLDYSDRSRIGWRRGFKFGSYSYATIPHLIGQHSFYHHHLHHNNHNSQGDNHQTIPIFWSGELAHWNFQTFHFKFQENQFYNRPTDPQNRLMSFG